MDTTIFKQWITKHHVRQKIVDSFWQCIHNYSHDGAEEFQNRFGEFDLEKISFSFDSINLCITSWDVFESDHNQEFVQAELHIEYNNQYVGWYGLLFHESGEPFDDVLVWDAL